MKVLKITDPPIKGYVDYAYPLSIILNYDYAWEWFYCNFIQLHFEENIHDPIRFYTADLNNNMWDVKNPLIDYQMINRDIFSITDMSIVKFIQNAIDLGNYVILFVDEFYISDRWAYQNIHYNHSIFIYGYNEEEKYFYTAGYDKNIRYSYSHTSYYEIEQAYLNNVKYDNDDLNKIYLLRINTNRKRYEFDLQAIIKQLKEYLYSEDSSKRFYLEFNGGYNLYFGMDIYYPLKLHLEAIHKYGWNWNIVKPIHILWEHKHLMALRIKYLEENGYIQGNSKYYTFFTELSETYMDIKIMFLKYKRNRKRLILDNIIELINDSVDKEKVIIEELINELEKKHSTEMSIASEGMYCKEMHILKSIYDLDKSYYGKIKVTFDVIVTAGGLNYLIGYAEEQALITSLYSLPIQIRLNSKGYFDAINFDKYSASMIVPYVKNQRYQVKIVIDLEAQNYDVYISTSEKEEIMIAEKFAFQKDTPAPNNISKICVLSNSINYITVTNHEVTVM